MDSASILIASRLRGRDQESIARDLERAERPFQNIPSPRRTCITTSHPVPWPTQSPEIQFYPSWAVPRRQQSDVYFTTSTRVAFSSCTCATLRTTYIMPASVHSQDQDQSMMDATAAAPQEQEQQVEQEDVLEEKRIIVVRLSWYFHFA